MSVYLMEVIPVIPIFWLWEVLDGGYSKLSNLLIMRGTWWRLFQAFQSSDYELTWWR
jgi:hypothetical protein